MTFVAAWRDGEDVFMVADSAVTATGAVPWETSSFGEAANHDRGKHVGERAIKLLSLRGEALIGVAGTEYDFATFLRELATELKKGLVGMRIALAAAAAARGDALGRFELLVGCNEGSGAMLLRVSSDGKALAIADMGESVTTIGSLPLLLTRDAHFVIDTFRRHPVPAEARLALIQVMLQSMGINEYLYEHGVGGALFGARVEGSRVVWQPDLVYLLTSPDLIARAGQPPARPEEGRFTPEGLEAIRVFVRDGVGVAMTTFAHPRIRVFRRPNEVVEGVPGRLPDEVLARPAEYLVPSRYYGVLHVGFHKAVFYATDDTKVPPEQRVRYLEVCGEPGSRTLMMAEQLVERLRPSVLPDNFECITMIEAAEGPIDWTVHRIMKAAGTLKLGAEGDAVPAGP